MRTFRYYITSEVVIIILRPDYINAITPFIDVPIVKILAGVRRCGKSTIFEMLVQELKNKGVCDDNIIERRYNSPEYDDFTSQEMYKDLKAATKGKGRCYLFLMSCKRLAHGKRW